ncbi:PqqD family protein [Companilactobacillus sp. DQM5]|uniref:PqqD family protein n=1 Tax=Companilactobacillus sp. DQM5 TaxID=3463359 RepID=UPI004059C077
MKEINLKNIKYRKNKDINYEINDDIVSIIRQQNHPIQIFLRKLHFKIPEKSYLDLDEFGSFVFLMIDGNKSVYEIGKELSKKYEQTNDLLFERLLVYLDHLEKNEKIISRV